MGANANDSGRPTPFLLAGDSNGVVAFNDIAIVGLVQSVELAVSLLLSTKFMNRRS